MYIYILIYNYAYPASFTSAPFLLPYLQSFLLFDFHTLLLELPVSFHPPENQGMAPSPWRVCSLKLTVKGDDPFILGVSASFSVAFAVSFRQGIWTDSFKAVSWPQNWRGRKKQLLRKWQPMKQGKHGKWFQSIWSKSYQSIRMTSK